MKDHKAVGTQKSEMGAAFNGKSSPSLSNKSRKSKSFSGGGATKSSGNSPSGVNKGQASKMGY